MKFSQIIELLLRPKGKVAFLVRLKADASILDIGCGNNSPYRFKKILPRCSYTGIDIGEYNQTKPNLADQYIITRPENLSGEIAKLTSSFDAVVSSHNLEHCNDRQEMLAAMLQSVKPGGLIYLSFPCQESIDFPKREGTLNYFDDPTHRVGPPNFDLLITELTRNGFQILYSERRYRPKVLWLFGCLFEPISARKRRNVRGTWEYWGFESIVWGNLADPPAPYG